MFFITLMFKLLVIIFVTLLFGFGTFDFCHNSDLNLKNWKNLIQKQATEVFNKNAIPKNLVYLIKKLYNSIKKLSPKLIKFGKYKCQNLFS